MNAATTWRAGSVCSGYGGLDLVAARILSTTPTWFADPDPAASRVLAHHWPQVPNLGDITAVDWTTTEQVHVLTGGTPCQDLSPAGKRAGLRRGNRSGVWHAMREAIAVQRPVLVLWENVRGALNAPADSTLEPCPGCMGDRDDRPVLRALGRVLGDLADLGYDAVWCCLPAAAVGCAHLRWRVFLAAVDTAAHPADLGHQRCGTARGRRSRPAHGGVRTHFPGQAAADTDGGRRRTAEPQDAQRLGDRARFGVDWREYTAAIRRHELTIDRPAPAPTITGARGGPKLSPVFTEWLMGLPTGWITNVPGLSVNDMLRLCGNGVVPLQAETAYRWLLPRLLNNAVSTPPAAEFLIRAVVASLGGDVTGPWDGWEWAAA